MRGTRAKALRRAVLGDYSPKVRKYQGIVRTIIRGQHPARATQDKRAAAIARGAAERAERKRLTDGDSWLAAQPWMAIERLRRVAGQEKGGDEVKVKVRVAVAYTADGQWLGHGWSKGPGGAPAEDSRSA